MVFDAVAGVELNGSTCAPNWLSFRCKCAGPICHGTGESARIHTGVMGDPQHEPSKNAEMPAKQAGG
jgi:hypothetical protein